MSGCIEGANSVHDGRPRCKWWCRPGGLSYTVQYKGCAKKQLCTARHIQLSMNKTRLPVSYSCAVHAQTGVDNVTHYSRPPSPPPLPQPYPRPLNTPPAQSNAHTRANQSPPLSRLLTKSSRAPHKTRTFLQARQWCLRRRHVN